MSYSGLLARSSDRAEDRTKKEVPKVSNCCSCYLCYRCLTTFSQKSDIKRHLNRKKQCEPIYKCPYTDSEVSEKSMNRFYFDDIVTLPTLSIKDRIELVMNYTDPVNVITKELLGRSSWDSLDLKESLIPIPVDHLKEADGSLPANSDNTPMVFREFKKSDYTIMVEGIERYKCTNCSFIFNSEKSLITHLNSTKTCKAYHHKKMIIDSRKAHETSKSIDDGSKKGSIQSAATIINGTYIQNQQNITNINNIQNNNIQNNNHIKPAIQLEIKDFFEDDYEYIHIDNGCVFDDSFFEHANFLSHIFSNDVNKNVYFDKGYAYLFVRGDGIVRIPKDKAGSIIMGKLSSAIGSYLRSNSLINAADYKYVETMYEIEKKKYDADTLYKKYNFKKKAYDDKMSTYKRTRDHNLTVIATALRKHKDTVAEVFQYLYPGYNPEETSNYEVYLKHFVAKRLRNEEFSDDS